MRRLRSFLLVTAALSAAALAIAAGSPFGEAPRGDRGLLMGAMAALAACSAALGWLAGRRRNPIEVSESPALARAPGEKGPPAPERGMLYSMVESIEEGLLLVNRDLTISYANGRVRKIFDLKANPVGRPLVESLRVPEALAAFREALETGTTATRSLRLAPARMEQVVLELRVVPYETAAPGAGSPGRVAVGLFVDMTRLERLENMRREFIADVSHELRTPLTAIKAAAETLHGEGDAQSGISAELARFPQILLKQALRMEALIDDLTELSLIETGAAQLLRENVDVRALALEAAADLQARANAAGVAIGIDAAAGTTVYSDRRRLSQIVVNLLDNAIKFSAAGSTVELRAGPLGAGAWIEVEDHGVGIAEAERERVFHRFYQVDRSRSKTLPGTGLGLAIVKHLMIQHGGTVRLTSAVGKGSTFRLEFPPPPNSPGAG